MGIEPSLDKIAELELHNHVKNNVFRIVPKYFEMNIQGNFLSVSLWSVFVCVHQENTT